MMFQDIQVFNSERLKDRVHRNSLLKMNNNKHVVSVLSFHNGCKTYALHKSKEKHK